MLSMPNAAILATFDVVARLQFKARIFLSPTVVRDAESGRDLIVFGAELMAANHSVAAVLAVRY